MRTRGIQWRKKCLQRSARCQNVVNQEHASAWWNLKAATELATRGSVSATHLFGEEPAHTEQSADLIRQQDAPSGWPNDEVNVATKRLNVLKALHRECVRDLCSGRGVLQQRPLLEVLVAMASALEEKVATLQRAGGEQQALDSLGCCCAIARIDRGGGVASGRRQRLA
jgi:hypothetical protein